MKALSSDNKHIKLPTKYAVDPSFDSSRFIKMRIRVCHTGENLNRTIFTLEGFDKARSSISNIPILANVLVDEEDRVKFGAHDITVVEDPNGDARLYYVEQPIGMIPETCNYAVEEYDGLRYVCVDGYIWRDYANYAEEIICTEKDVPVSMEIDINDYLYLKDTDRFLVNDYAYRGITFLGYDVQPAMRNAEASICEEYTSQDSNAFMEQMQVALQSEFNIQEQRGTKEASTLNTSTDNTTEVTSGEEIQENMSNTGEATESEPVEPEEQNAVPESETPAESEGDMSAEPEVVPETSNAADEYALMSQLYRSLNEALSEIKIDDDGYVRQKYWIEDIDADKQLVYVWSLEDANYYAASYVIEGDKISLIANFRRQVQVFRDFVDGQDTTYERTNRYATPLSEYKELKEKYDNDLKELETLREFQANVIAEQKQAALEAVLEQFTDLAGNEEFEALKKASDDYTVEDFEKECFAIRGKVLQPKSDKFNYSNKNHVGAHFSLPFDAQGQSTGDRISDMIKHYNTKG